MATLQLILPRKDQNRPPLLIELRLASDRSFGDFSDLEDDSEQCTRDGHEAVVMHNREPENAIFDTNANCEELYDGSLQDFHGKLLRGNSPLKTGTTVLCKVAKGSEPVQSLREEAALYTDPEAIQTLRGLVVPEFYGFYTGHDGEGDDFACILFSDYDIVLFEECDSPSDSDKKRVMDHLFRIHDIGFHILGDDPNIAIDVKDKTLRIVNFNNVARHGGKCKPKKDAFILHTFQKSTGGHPDLGCKVLQSAAEEIYYFTPVNITVQGSAFSTLVWPTRSSILKVFQETGCYKSILELVREEPLKKEIDNAYHEYGKRWSHRQKDIMKLSGKEYEEWNPYGLDPEDKRSETEKQSTSSEGEGIILEGQGRGASNKF